MLRTIHVVEHIQPHAHPDATRSTDPSKQPAPGATPSIVPGGTVFGSPSGLMPFRNRPVAVRYQAIHLDGEPGKSYWIKRSPADGRHALYVRDPQTGAIGNTGRYVHKDAQGLWAEIGGDKQGGEAIELEDRSPDKEPPPYPTVASPAPSQSANQNHALLVGKGLAFGVPGFLDERPPSAASFEHGALGDMERIKANTWKKQRMDFQALVDNHERMLADVIQKDAAPRDIVALHKRLEAIQVGVLEEIQLQRHADDLGLFHLDDHGVSYLAKQEYRFGWPAKHLHDQDRAAVESIGQHKQDYEKELRAYAKLYPSISQVRAKQRELQGKLNEQIKNATDEKKARLSEHDRRITQPWRVTGTVVSIATIASSLGAAIYALYKSFLNEKRIDDHHA